MIVLVAASTQPPGTFPLTLIGKPNFTTKASPINKSKVCAAPIKKSSLGVYCCIEVDAGYPNFYKKLDLSNM